MNDLGQVISCGNVGIYWLQFVLFVLGFFYVFFVLLVQVQWQVIDKDVISNIKDMVINMKNIDKDFNKNFVIDKYKYVFFGDWVEDLKQYLFNYFSIMEQDKQ